MVLANLLSWPVAYAENFHGVFIRWHRVVICIWCALSVASQFDVIVLFLYQHFGKFVDIMCTFFHTSTLLILCHCTKYKLLALQVRLLKESTPNATIQQFVTAKISGGALKQGSTTHSSIRQSNLHSRNEAALMSCRIRAVKHIV